MARYRSRDTIDAVKWDGSNDAEVQALAPNAIVRRATFDEDHLPRLLIEAAGYGNVFASVGDYVVRFPRGAVRVDLSSQFDALYEEVSE